MILEGIRLISLEAPRISKLSKKAESAFVLHKSLRISAAGVKEQRNRHQTIDQTCDLSIQRTAIKLVPTNTRRSREINSR
jgi:hypothetical protein